MTFLEKDCKSRWFCLIFWWSLRGTNRQTHTRKIGPIELLVAAKKQIDKTLTFSVIRSQSDLNPPCVKYMMYYTYNALTHCATSSLNYCWCFNIKIRNLSTASNNKFVCNYFIFIYFKYLFSSNQEWIHKLYDFCPVNHGHTIYRTYATFVPRHT